jgi:hypothetical protein
MDINTVRNNLKQTIRNKEGFFQQLQGQTGIVAETTAHFLLINIEELKKILADVEECCKKATADSWKGSVDRQGGSFDASEINRNTWI